MKHVCALSILFFLNFIAGAQTLNPSTPLSISYNKTINLIFPYPIKSVDRGSKEVLAQKAKGVDNVLQLKAGKENFAETSLSVITANGKVYSFLVNYSLHPASFNIRFDKDTSDHTSVQFNAESIASQSGFLNCIRKSSYGIVMQVKGIFIKSDIIYYKLELQNRSNINYDIAMLRFFIKDKKQSRRTASQELDQLPQYVYGNRDRIPANSKQAVVVALRKFTIPDKKILYLQLIEKDGGRNLQIKLHNRTHIKAKSFGGQD